MKFQDLSEAKYHGAPSRAFYSVFDTEQKKYIHFRRNAWAATKLTSKIQLFDTREEAEQHIKQEMTNYGGRYARQVEQWVVLEFIGHEV